LGCCCCWGGLPGNTHQSTAWKHETSPSARRWPCSPVMTRGWHHCGAWLFGLVGQPHQEPSSTQTSDCHVRSAQTALYHGYLTQTACLCVQLHLPMKPQPEESEPSAKRTSSSAPAPVTGKECRRGRMPDKEGREHSSRVQAADARLPVEVPGRPLAMASSCRSLVHPVRLPCEE
jgi:hypothetical protein